MKPAPKKVYLDVVGCPENRYDMAQMLSYLEKRGAVLTINPAEADTLIINTCGLTKRNEEVSLEVIKKLKEVAQPHARFIINGCLPIINRAALDECSSFAEIIPGPRLEPLPRDVDTPPDTDKVFNPHLYPQRLILEPEKIFILKNGLLWILDRILYRWTGICPPLRPRFYVKIATGCNRPCTFCAVRISRGKLRSQPVDWIVEHVREGVEAGYKTITLIGTNVSGYGQDLGTNLPALLKKVLAINDSFRLELRNAEPEEVIRFLPEFLEVLKTKRIRYLEFPLQSGSNRILRLMRRGYTAEEFSQCLLEMKRVYPKLFVRTQVMVGFPTETEEDFQQSLKMIKTLPVDYIETFFFSPRPGTKAAEMEGRIDKKILRARYKRLQKVAMHSKVPFKLKIFFGFLLNTLLHPSYIAKYRRHTKL